MAVRRESVQLDVTGNFVSEMARAAGAVALLRTELDRLDGNRFNANVNVVNRQMTSLTRTAQQSSNSLNQFTGRAGLAADALLALGPAAIPIAAQLTPAVAGLALAAGSAALAGGSLLIAFQGVGDAIKAVNEAALDPTSANLLKAEEAFRSLSPAARGFVAEFQQMRPVFQDIRNAAAEGWFPGLTDALGSLERMAPRLADLLQTIGETGGQIVADGADSLAGPRWAEFIDFLGAEVPDAMTSLARATGDLTHGLTELLMSSNAGADSFLGWVESVANAFDEWASSAEGRADVEAFLAYAAETGPKVAEFFGALVDAFAAIVKAAQPIGDVMLPALTAMLDAVSVIASSDMATPILAAVIAMRTLSRVTALQAAAQSRMIAAVGPRGATAAQTAAMRPGSMGPQAVVAGAAARFSNLTTGQRVAGAAGIAGLAAVSTGLADSIGATNTALGVMYGSLAGPWGAAVGGAIGLTKDLTAANDDLAGSIENASSLTLDSSLADIKAARADLAAKLQEYANADGFSGGFKRGMAFLSADDIEAKRTGQYLDGLEVFVRSLRQEAARTNPAIDGLASSFSRLSGELVLATNAYDDFAQASKSALGFLGRQSALLAYEDAVDAARAAIKELGQVNTIVAGKLTADGRKVVASLIGVGEAGIRAAEGLRKVQRDRFLDGLKADLRSTAEAAGLPTGAVNNLLQRLGLLKTVKVKPEVEVEDRKAQRQLQGLFADLDALDGDTANPAVNVRDNATRPLAGIRGALTDINGRVATATVQVKINRTVQQLNSAVSGFMGSADGSTVPKDSMPYGDRYPYLLAPGEEVISNRRGQADRYRPLLKAINAGRLADGGTAMASLLSQTTTGGVGAMGPFAQQLNQTTGFLIAERRERVRLLGVERDRQATLLNDLKSQRRNLLSSVSGRFTGTPFGESGLPQIGGGSAGSSVSDALERSRLLSELAGRGMPLALLAKLSAEASVDDLRTLARYSSGQLADFRSDFAATATPQGRLRSGLDEARRVLKALRALRKLGLSGAALADAAQNASASELEALVAQGKAGVSEFSALFNERDRIANTAGQFAGSAVFDRRIAEQTAELREATREFREAKQVLRELERQQRRAAERAEKNADRQVKATDRTTDAIKGATSGASRGRRD